MAIEIRLNDRNSNVELIKKDKNYFEISVDGKLYKLDAVMVEEGVYSILYNNLSYNVELIDGDNPKKYIVNTLYNSFDIEIIDAETRYLLSRNRNLQGDEEKVIASPMPGKIVKITVKVGDKVDAGDTVIIVSAMKMESEYKAGQAGVIEGIHVKEGETIEGHQPLITIE